MPKLSPEDRAALAQKLMSVDPAQFGQISDQFMQELVRRTNGLPMPTTRATSTPTASPAPAASPAATPMPLGMTAAGNIDLNNRPRVKNANGSISTVRSIGVNVDGKEILLPTVSDDGRIMSDQEAIENYKKTGKHLGMFDSPDHSTAYAKSLHEAQAALISKPNVSPDVAYLAKTAFGEGEGEGPEGQRAIMHVIANRMSRKKGKSVQDIVQAPSQFESWDQKNPRRSVMEGLDLNDPKHAALVALAQAVLAGKDKDNTSGSTLFYNPKNASPGWAQRAKPTAMIGAHQFLAE